ncbi:hypothetical protein OG422_18905 [Streptomyces sp. NBC_01525]|uniref:Uncharacterized protein n=1 Tax=Streptomyces benahoarensis TaxID=2595054 RepID=A0A553YWS7_9ACTN|nr:hypothetical protein [Streptomyces benahoarensis]TSB17783.1 hypothetical protein FNJ62_26465 [Streptomyces benahoarensis]TSB33668.1 hypothetical protein FNZ23_23305 [Streptomyces benahoarensis]
MSSATITPAAGHPASLHPMKGATALGPAHSGGHPVGSALRAVKVFATAAFSVVLLGEYGEERADRRVPRPRATDRIRA